MIIDAQSLGQRFMSATNETIDWILDQIRQGVSNAEIATLLGVSASSISLWLDRDEDVIQRSARAKAESAEAWLDRGLRTIESALKRDAGVDANAARAIAQECARRAAIRNPAYRERTGVEITGAKGGPIKTIAATATPEQAASIYKEIMG